MSTFKPDLVVPHEWYGFDFNRTLAEYHSYWDDMALARPLPLVERVKRYLAEGKVCKILSAQVWTPPTRRYLSKPTEAEQAWLEEAKGYYARARKAETTIKAWCLQHIGQVLEVTCERDRGCQEVWDDKAYHVVPNSFAPRRDGIIVYEESGPWPNEKMQELMAQWKSKPMQLLYNREPTDVEIERAFFEMLKRNAGVLPSHHHEWPVTPRYVHRLVCSIPPTPEELAEHQRGFPLKPNQSFSTAHPGSELGHPAQS